jgi:hypothetical protein
MYSCMPSLLHQLARTRPWKRTSPPANSCNSMPMIDAAAGHQQLLHICASAAPQQQRTALSMLLLDVQSAWCAAAQLCAPAITEKRGHRASLASPSCTGVVGHRS